jgi:hypothetical protein
MKLRFHGNTLRLRLSQSDVARLAETGRVEERVMFGAGQTLAYVLETAETDGVGASFEGGKIRVTLSRAAAKRWMEGFETGIERSSGELRVLVEKDFQCMHGDAEANADAFPNPLAANREPA